MSLFNESVTAWFEPRIPQSAKGIFVLDVPNISLNNRFLHRKGDIFVSPGAMGSRPNNNKLSPKRDASPYPSAVPEDDGGLVGVLAPHVGVAEGAAAAVALPLRFHRVATDQLTCKRGPSVNASRQSASPRMKGEMSLVVERNGRTRFFLTSRKDLASQSLLHTSHSSWVAPTRSHQVTYTVQR